MDFAAIQAAVSSLKAATDISKSILEMKSISDVRGKVIELQGALLEAQNSALAATTSQFELQEQVRTLQAKLKEREDWATEKLRYRLVSPWDGPAQNYALLREHSNGEEPHFLCANCFNRETKSILNPLKNKTGWVQLVCPICKATMDTGYRGIGPPQYAEDLQGEG